MRMRYCVAACIALIAGSASGEILPPDSAVDQAVDHYVNLRLSDAQIVPAPLAEDTTLVRRLTLDLAGRIPSVPEVQEYLQSSQPDKRVLLVDRLMASDEFADYLAARFDWFITQGDGRIAEYLKTAFRDKRGWDRVFRDIILADLRPETSAGAIDFLKERVEDADRLTNDVSVAFFGVNISCARCHDHFLAPDWTQDHYYGMKSFFSRTFKNGDFVAEREYGDAVKFNTTAGEEREAEPMFLTSTVVEVEAVELSDEERKQREEALEKCKEKNEAPPLPQASLRERLVDVALADGENDFFARAIVNRLWHHFFGAGLVMPLDQMHSENPPSHPELLAWLAQDLVAHGYDLRRLIRGIVTSDAYARSSQWESEDRPPPDVFAVASPRPLTPTQFARSLSLATADPEPLSRLQGEELYRRVAELAEPRNLERFDQPSDDFRISASESLWFNNSSEFQDQYLQRGLVERLLQMDEPLDRIKTAIGVALCRPPTAEEVELLQDYLNDRGDRPEEACRQMVWSLLAGSEFRFNH